MPGKVESLFQELNSSGTRYCHWKSNSALEEVLEGQTDVDLLVHRADADRFRATLDHLGFRPATSMRGQTLPSVESSIGLDEESGSLIHLHTYYRVITGESLSKNYRLPLEDMLLQNTRKIGSVTVPAKSAELVVFVLRMMLKHTSFVELILLARDWKHVRQEVPWLLNGTSIDVSSGLVSKWLPSIDPDLFSACAHALQSSAPLLRRIALGLRLRSRLRGYSRGNALGARLRGVQIFAGMLRRRLTRSGKNMRPQSGGAVIAFVGSEATGKSTLLSEMSRWLGEHFAVARIHAGKPPPTMVSALPNLMLPTLRAMLPGYRSTRLEAGRANDHQEQSPKGTYPLIYGLRAVLLAHDRRHLLTRAFRWGANGVLVLCDRYPSLQSGAPDSPQLSHWPDARGMRSLRSALTNAEARLYREIPPPDLVIYLQAPLEVTVLRNASRGKTEPEEFVRWRHSQTRNLDFGQARVQYINTDQPFDQTVHEIKRVIWSCL